jgi:PAS domain S-box-containing protein
MERISQNRGNRFLTRPFLIQWLFLGMVLLTLAGIMSYYLARERSSIEKQEQERLTNLAKVLDENIAHHLYATNQALVGIRDDPAYWNTKQGVTSSLISQRLQTMSDAMPGIRTIAILNGAGTVVASNRKDLTGRNFAERDYFKIPRQHPSPDMLYLSPPFKTVLGAWAFGLSLPVFDHKGAFNGIVTATIDSEYFITLLQSILYSPDMRTSLNHGDGKIFLIVPGRKDVEGMDLAKPGSFYTRHVESKQTANLFKGLLYATGDERMIALRTIKSDKFKVDKPLMVAVSRDLPAVFAAWRENALRQSTVFGLLALAALMSMYIYHRQEKNFKSIEADHLAKLHENEERYRTVAEFTYDWEYWIGPDRRFIYTSPSCDRITGHLAEAFMKDPDLLMTIVHPDDRDRIGDHMDDVADLGAESHESEFRILSTSGEVRWIAHVCKVVRAHDGAYLGRRASNRDITDRKKAEQKLAESEKKYRELVQNVNSIILRWSQNGEIMFMNEFGRQFFGYSEDELIGRHIIGTIVPENESTGRDLRPLLESIAADPKAFEQNINENMRHNGERVWISWANKTVLDADGQVQEILSIGSDITERKQAEEALEEEKRRLQQALDEVRTLRGIVPICAYCKKIRDDKGYWSQVEKYVSDHTDAQFSHGVCPTCFEKEMKGLKERA